MVDLWLVSLMFCGSDRVVTLDYDSEDEARSSFDRWVHCAVQEEFPNHIETDRRGVTVCLFGGGPLEAVMLAKVEVVSQESLQLETMNWPGRRQ